MHPVLGICPVCGGPLAITRLHCRACDTTIEGHFYTGRLSQLTPEQIQFVEVFLQCEGKLKAVEDRLGISYPTVRSRLRDVIRAMGYETPADEDENISEEDRRRILNDLAQGNITYEQAMDLLQGTK